MLKNSGRLQRTAGLVCSLLALCSAPLYAGIIDMPNTNEVPDPQKKSMTLDMDVPSVREREADPQAGPRLNVKEFRLQGVVEYPELGITREGLNKKVEALRFDLMGEGEKTKSGYTLKELAEISDLVAEIEEQTQEKHVEPVDVQKLVFLVREQRRKRGVTLGMIESVADTITQYYRERGFILAKAYIPQQQVRDGVVSLTLLLGKLGDVEVQNNKRYSARTLQRPFDRDLDQPVTAERIEENLYLINDLPGLYAQGYFQPGKQVGDSTLTLNVTSERWYDGSLRFDNHGSKTTGEYRGYGEFQLHNPLWLGDQLTVGALETVNPDNTTYGSLRYSLPLYTPRLRFDLGLSNNDFVSNFGGGATNSGVIEFTGKSEVKDAGLHYAIKRSRKKNHSIDLTYADIKTTLNVGGGTNTESTDKNLTLGYNFDTLNEQSQRLHQARIALVHSENTPDPNFPSNDGTQPSSDFVTANYSTISFVGLPLLQNKARWILNVEGQFADKELSAVNRFDLSGPSRARGFDINHFNADDAMNISSELIFASPNWLKFGRDEENKADIIQPFLFTDLAYGVAHSADNQDSTGSLADMGVGVKINTQFGLRGSLSVAAPIVDEIKMPAGEKASSPEASSARVYFELQYSF